MKQETFDSLQKGDKVRVKSFEEIQKYPKENYPYMQGYKCGCDSFVTAMEEFCGKQLQIQIEKPSYGRILVKENRYFFTPEMLTDEAIKKEKPETIEIKPINFPTFEEWRGKGCPNLEVCGCEITKSNISDSNNEFYIVCWTNPSHPYEPYPKTYEPTQDCWEKMIKYIEKYRKEEIMLLADAKVKEWGKE
jgi:hypothetical protein